MNDPLLIVDGQFLAYQVHYTMQNINNGDTPTGVLYGFLARIVFLTRQFRTHRIAFCWDERGSKRKKMFSTYKANRGPSTPEERESRQSLYEQVSAIRHNVLPRTGFRNNFAQAGYEADDLIARLCQTYDNDIIIVSADHDLYQLLRPGVRMYNPTLRKMVGVPEFKNTFKISPTEWINVKAIAGCHTDNVPGIEGVGIPTAIKYLKGELKGVKAQRIKDQWKEVVERNLPLVTVPLEGTRRIRWKPDDQLSWEGFLHCCNLYGMKHFIEGETSDHWRWLITGGGMAYEKWMIKNNKQRRTDNDEEV